MFIKLYRTLKSDLILENIFLNQTYILAAFNDHNDSSGHIKKLLNFMFNDTGARYVFIYLKLFLNGCLIQEEDDDILDKKETSV